MNKITTVASIHIVVNTHCQDNSKDQRS